MGSNWHFCFIEKVFFFFLLHVFHSFPCPLLTSLTSAFCLNQDAHILSDTLIPTGREYKYSLLFFFLIKYWAKSVECHSEGHRQDQSLIREKWEQYQAEKIIKDQSWSRWINVWELLLASCKKWLHLGMARNFIGFWLNHNDHFHLSEVGVGKN